MKGLTQVLGEPARVARSFVNGYEAMIAVRPLLIGDIMMPKTLHGRKVVVVGGTSGIGLAVAKAVLADGATVVVGSHNRAKIDAAVAALGMSATGGVLNVNDESSITAFFEQVGPLDHLVYTAGDWNRRNNNIGNNFDLTDAQAGFGIRFWGALLAVKHAMPMIAPEAPTVALRRKASTAKRSSTLDRYRRGRRTFDAWASRRSGTIARQPGSAGIDRNGSLVPTTRGSNAKDGRWPTASPSGTARRGCRSISVLHACRVYDRAGRHR